MTTDRRTVEDFLRHSRLVLVRLSPSSPVQGLRLDEELAACGYDIAVVYLEDALPESRLTAVKDAVGGAIIAVPRSQSERAVRETIAAGIANLWIQRTCDEKAAIELCERQGIPVVYGECILTWVRVTSARFSGGHCHCPTCRHRVAQQPAQITSQSCTLCSGASTETTARIEV